MALGTYNTDGTKQTQKEYYAGTEKGNYQFISVNLTKISTGENTCLRKEELIKMPIMVLSSKCHLRGLSPRQLVQRKEDHFEIGGYFIASGNEKVMRPGVTLSRKGKVW